MEEKRYSISEASEILDLETHVLRYWEEELDLQVPRNEMGHRYYADKEIKLFEHIKSLKEQGLQLKAIKIAISHMDEEESYTLKLKNEGEINIADPKNEKVKQFQLMMKNLFKEALVEQNNAIKEELKEELKEDLKEDLKENLQQNLKEEVSTQMKSLEIEYETKEKERYRRLDEVLREVQSMRREAAVSITTKKPWYKQMFGK